jgi:hypothetical protein
MPSSPVNFKHFSSHRFIFLMSQSRVLPQSYCIYNSQIFSASSFPFYAGTLALLQSASGKGCVYQSVHT